MKKTATVMGAALVCAILLGSRPCFAQTGYPYYPACVPQIPDACGRGYYSVNPHGAVYGPNYCLRPCFPPFNGFAPNPYSCPPAGTMKPKTKPVVVFPTHPFARGPRDYFMLD